MVRGGDPRRYATRLRRRELDSRIQAVEHKSDPSATPVRASCEFAEPSRVSCAPRRRAGGLRYRRNRRGIWNELIPSVRVILILAIAHLLPPSAVRTETERRHERSLDDTCDEVFQGVTDENRTRAADRHQGHNLVSLTNSEISHRANPGNRTRRALRTKEHRTLCDWREAPRNRTSTGRVRAACTIRYASASSPTVESNHECQRSKRRLHVQCVGVSPLPRS